MNTLPNDLKVGKVIPVHKSGDFFLPLNYRPISTSIPCELLEHVIYCYLVILLETHLFFSSFQHGFRKHHSCETQLLAFTNDLLSALDCSLDVDCIFLDFARAFDTVSHNLLLLKLNMLNIDVSVIKWIVFFTQSHTISGC